jgi:hypothetical protein
MTEMRKTYGRTPSGKLITEELIEKISREAEEGWDVEELLKASRSIEGSSLPSRSHGRSAARQRHRQ